MNNVNMVDSQTEDYIVIKMENVRFQSSFWSI